MHVEEIEYFNLSEAIFTNLTIQFFMETRILFLLRIWFIDVHSIHIFMSPFAYMLCRKGEPILHICVSAFYHKY